MIVLLFVKRILQIHLVSNDKDLLKCIPGKHFNQQKNEWIETSEQEADYNFAVSLIAGDTTDNIKGLKGKGVKYAEKLFNDSVIRSILISLAQEAYITQLGEYEGIKEFALNYQLLKMLEVYPNFPQFEIR